MWFWKDGIVIRPRQSRVKLPFYLGNDVEVESKGKDITMG